MPPPTARSADAARALPRSRTPRDTAPPVAEPSLPTLRAAIVYALCTLALGYQALAGRFLVNPNSDQFRTGYAYREYGTDVLRTTGEFAQWNPYILGGIPYSAAGGAGDVFYPTFILRLLLPVDVG